MANQTTAGRSSPGAALIGWMIAAAVVLLFAYWNDLSTIGEYWDSPEYSHGYLIPLFAFVLLGREKTLDRLLPGFLGGAATGSGAGAAKWGPAEIVGGALLLFGGGLIWLAEWLLHEPSIKYTILLFGFSFGVSGGLLLVRPDFTPPQAAMGRWFGVALLTAACGVRLWSAWHFAVSPSYYSFVIAAGGLFLMVYGWNGLRWSWPSVALLTLLFPMPAALRAMTVEPLQSLATRSSTYVLQTFGLPADCIGNTITMGDAGALNVAEACSGLSMATIFLALSVMIAAFIDRPLWERVAVVAGSIPIALSVNIMRIVVTAFCKYVVGDGIQFLGIEISKEFIDTKCHDWAGLFMMPIALALLWLELQLLAKVFVDVEEAELTAPEFVMSHRDREPVSAGG